MTNQSNLVFVIPLIISLIGCDARKKDATAPAMPRPVTVMVLEETDSSRLERQAGTVSAWKTEEIGFEVSGRVTFVAEEGTAVEGQINNADGNPVKSGSHLATLDPERYQLNVASVQAQIETTKQQREAVRIEADDVLPAERRAMAANLTYAQAEMDRTGPLAQRGAITQSEYERDVANRDAAAAKVAEAEARQKAKIAELASMDASIKELQQTLAEAEKDVADCALYSPFPGQIAKVHVIPGAYVNSGERVVTAQMMDPTSVVVEVSAETARRVNYRDIVPVHVTTLERSQHRINGSIYTIDPVADAETRTFTLTILLRNERVQAAVPEALKDKPVVRTSVIRRVVDRMPDFAKDVILAEVGSIQHDDQGAFLWKIENRRIDVSAGQDDLLLKVSKLRVVEGQRSVSFLGLATFREIAPTEGQQIDPATDLFTGKLELPPDVEEPWNGDVVLYDHGRWLLRPGDIVGVDLTGEDALAGFYVPMNAISKVSDSYAVLVAAPEEDAARVQRVPVNVFSGPGTLKRIEPIQADALQPGHQLIVGGVHYIQDGDAVTVVEEVEVRR